MAKRKYVDVTVVWGNDDVAATVKIPIADWEEIRKGEEYYESATYRYEGEKFTADFQFNTEKKGSLIVTYDDGGEGFNGSISDAAIVGGEW